METDETTRDVVAAYLEEEPDTPESLQERLRGHREKAAERTYVDLPIPGYGGELWCRHRLMTPKELDEIGKKVREQVKTYAERISLATQDNLIASCLGFHVKRGDDLVPLDPDGVGEPMKFDTRLAEFLGFEVKTARENVLAVFGGNALAVTGYGMALSRWFSDTSVDVAEELLGEV